jgi:hypothetical protein
VFARGLRRPRRGDARTAPQAARAASSAFTIQPPPRTRAPSRS